MFSWATATKLLPFSNCIYLSIKMTSQMPINSQKIEVHEGNQGFLRFTTSARICLQLKARKNFASNFLMHAVALSPENEKKRILFEIYCLQVQF